MKPALTKQQCKDKVAQKFGFKDFYAVPMDLYIHLFDDCISLYARQTRIVAAEQAKTKIIDSHKCNLHGCGRPIQTKRIDKDSIINADLTSIEK